MSKCWKEKEHEKQSRKRRNLLSCGTFLEILSQRLHVNKREQRAHLKVKTPNIFWDVMACKWHIIELKKIIVLCVCATYSLTNFFHLSRDFLWLFSIYNCFIWGYMLYLDLMTRIQLNFHKHCLACQQAFQSYDIFFNNNCVTWMFHFINKVMIFCTK